MEKVIGVDLGGTKINTGLLDRQGNIIKQVTIPSGGNISRNQVLTRIKRSIDEIIDEEVVGIGIGTPGFIDIQRGKVLSVGGNIKDWEGTDIRKELGEFYNIPIHVENDANVAAICEAWLGSGKGLKSFVMITLGTGVGGGIYSCKTGILHGENYRAGEIGHSILYPGGRECVCGQKGCAERYISGTGIEENYYELTGIRKTGKEIFEDYKIDFNGKKAVEKFIFDISNFLVTIKNTLDPEGIIIGGGVINSSHIWWDRINKNFKDFTNDSTGTKIFKAKYLNNSGLIGAGKLAFERK